MRTEQWIYAGTKAAVVLPNELHDAQLVLVFGSPKAIRHETHGMVREKYAAAIIAGCSSSGEISGSGIYDHCVVVTAVKFEASHIQFFSVELSGVDQSSASRQFARQYYPRHRSEACPDSF